MVEQTPKQSLLRQILGIGPIEPIHTVIESGVPGIDWKLIDYTSVDIVALRSHKENIELLEKQGGHPLTFQEIQNSIGNDFDKWVLFDTMIGSFNGGNRWRVWGVDPETREVTLSFCGPFGTYDIKDIEPFTLPIDTPFFTGVSVQENIHETMGPLSLEEVNKVYKQLLKAPDTEKSPLTHKETIYWVDEILIDPKYVDQFKYIPHS